MDKKSLEFKYLMLLKKMRYILTPQQYRTLKGQCLKGDLQGAIKGLEKIAKGVNDVRTKRQYQRT